MYQTYWYFVTTLSRRDKLFIQLQCARVLGSIFRKYRQQVALGKNTYGIKLEPDIFKITKLETAFR